MSKAMQIDCVASEGAIQHVVDRLRAINTEAVILRTEQCKIDLSQILHRGTFHPERSIPQTSDQHHANKKEDSKTDSSSHQHDSQIQTLRLELPGVMNLQR